MGNLGTLTVTLTLRHLTFQAGNSFPLIPVNSLKLLNGLGMLFAEVCRLEDCLLLEFYRQMMWPRGKSSFISNHSSLMKLGDKYLYNDISCIQFLVLLTLKIQFGHVCWFVTSEGLF